jgi:DNA-binding CsgD family transcriptional regulator
MYPYIDVLTYNSLNAFIQDSNRHFVQFYVSEDILFCSADEFELLKAQTFVISKGANPTYESAGFNVLDITIPEQELVSRLLYLHKFGQKGGSGISPADSAQSLKAELSARERDVLALMVKGYINKEIADRLNISLTTVIFHRNNICDKLQTRSVGKLTIYAVLAGILQLNEI